MHVSMLLSPSVPPSGVQVCSLGLRHCLANEASPPTGQNGHHLKNLQTIKAGENVEKRETSCKVGM